MAIVQARPHKGQIRAARNMRSVLLLPSTIQDSHKNCGQVQDSYSLRCIPQVTVHLPVRLSRDETRVITDRLSLNK